MASRLAAALLLTLLASEACGGSDHGAPDAASDVRSPRDVAPDASSSCPLSPPTPGAACFLPASFPCSFGDPCSFDRYGCKAGRWVEEVVDGAVPEPCPVSPPATGSTCASCGKSFHCDYPAPCGATTTSTCSGGHWLTGTTFCDAASPTDAPGATE